ncbi:hypothetical protein [Streptomyces sp. 8L]|uniref:hypothetical protein n=1 Tax=Streptomyces sp. 8L TaxID=2877242 RepID=UPI001CD35C6B|nr:hypothetical protein [Streptomyces sp. 8L]MCA1218845.1 hypothetical protein [Streptomyces sp. 8L]
MRVRVWNRYEERPQIREGTIRERSWGRDRGKPIYWFSVKLDGIEGTWVFGPGELAKPE